MSGGVVDRYATCRSPELEQNQRVFVPARVVGVSIAVPGHVLVEVEHHASDQVPVCVLVPRSEISVEASDD